MTIQELIEKLSGLPEKMRNEMELTFFSTSDGSKFVARDVSQFQMMGGKLNLFVEPVETTTD